MFKQWSYLGMCRTCKSKWISFSESSRTCVFESEMFITRLQILRQHIGSAIFGFKTQIGYMSYISVIINCFFDLPKKNNKLFFFFYTHGSLNSIGSSRVAPTKHVGSDHRATVGNNSHARCSVGSPTSHVWSQSLSSA